jgi:hypothetical protein
MAMGNYLGGNYNGWRQDEIKVLRVVLMVATFLAVLFAVLLLAL